MLVPRAWPSLWGCKTEPCNIKGRKEGVGRGLGQGLRGRGPAREVRLQHSGHNSGK